jgi:hypothetical protein
VTYMWLSFDYLIEVTMTTSVFLKKQTRLKKMLILTRVLTVTTRT